MKRVDVTMNKWWKLKTSWDWWRWEADKSSGCPRNSFWDALLMTLRYDIVSPINEVYCWIWLRVNCYKMRYIPWCKMRRMKRKIDKLEKGLGISKKALDSDLIIEQKSSREMGIDEAAPIDKKVWDKLSKSKE